MKNPLSYVLFVGTVLSSGCFSLLAPRSPAPSFQVKNLGERPAVPATAAGNIQVLSGASDLPVGLLFARAADGRKKLHAVPSFPTPENAHVVIGAVAVDMPTTGPRPSQRAVLAGFKEKASEMGGNAIFRPSPTSRFAYVVYVAPAGAAESPPAHTALLAKEAASLDEYRPKGRPMEGDLGGAAAIELDLRRGTCYAVAVALDGDARLNDDGQRHLVLNMKSGDPLMLNRSHMATEKIADVDGIKIEAPMNGRYVRLRSFSGALGCAWGNGKATVALQTRGRGTDIGSGHFHVQVFTRKISNKELTLKKRKMDKAMAAAEVRAQEYRRQERARAAERERERQERQRRDEERRAQTAARTTSSGSGSYYSFSLKNECRQTVKLFINSGGNPKFSGGTSSSIGANTIRSFSGSGSKTFWIVDSSGQGISSFTASGGQRDMRILPGCTGFAPR